MRATPLWSETDPASRIFRTWGVNLNYLNEAETVAQASLIVSETLFNSTALIALTLRR